MSDMTKLVQGYYRSRGIASAAFDADTLALLPLTQAHGSVIEYLDLVPASDYAIGGVRVHGRESMVLENTELVPGCMVSPHGFLAFASTEGGDVFVMETPTSEVFLLPHDLYEPNGMISGGWNENCTAFLPSLPVTPDNIKASCVGSLGHLGRFLTMIFNERIGQTLEW